jgi:predicted ABC-type transport system involved in lysophospholipase L1 biosynthesis ATPase subunit
VAIGELADSRPLRRSVSGALGAAVTLTHVRVRGRDDRPAADDISLHIPAGQSVALYDQADGSAVEVIDVVAGRRRLRNGQVTVHGTRHWMGVPATDRPPRDRWRQSGRTPLLLPSRRVDTLSAQQQWRILIARALLIDPQLLMAEDPAPYLDSRAASRALDLLMDAQARCGFTLLLATGRLATAARCERVVSLTDGLVTGDELIADDAWTRGRVDRIG